MRHIDSIRSGQFSDGLDQNGLTAKDASELFDQRQDRIMEWLHGERRIPDWAFVILALLTLPGGRDLAFRTVQHLHEEEHNLV